MVTRLNILYEHIKKKKYIIHKITIKIHKKRSFNKKKIKISPVTQRTNRKTQTRFVLQRVRITAMTRNVTRILAPHARTHHRQCKTKTNTTKAPGVRAQNAQKSCEPETMASPRCPPACRKCTCTRIPSYFPSRRREMTLQTSVDSQVGKCRNPDRDYAARPLGVY